MTSTSAALSIRFSLSNIPPSIPLQSSNVHRNVCSDNRVTSLASYYLFGLINMDQKGLEGNAAVGRGKTLSVVFPITLGTPLRCINVVEYKREGQVNSLLTLWRRNFLLNFSTPCI